MAEALDLVALVASCEDEPIHTPGSVQPHGVLLVLDNGRMVGVSANCQALLGFDSSLLLGASLANIGPLAAIAGVLDAPEGEVVLVTCAAGRFEAVQHAFGGLVLVELEPAPEDDLAHDRLHKALRGFHGSTDVLGLIAQTARTVQELTGFDRVLVYRFDDDWTGQVIAESAGSRNGEFLGLRFPASDIPPQARAMYDTAALRLIPDTTTAASPVLTVDAGLARTLDMSLVSLRSVSPIHLRYLQNMGVAASMSIALFVGGRLWGLVSCHHLVGPLRPSRSVRDALDLVARTSETILAALLASESAAAHVAFVHRVDELTEPMWRDNSPAPELVLAQSDLFLRLFEATGAAIVTGGGCQLVGACPPLALVQKLVASTRDAGTSHVAIDDLGSIDAEWSGHAAVAAGALGVRIDPSGERWLFWFRPETREVIRWGGDPTWKVATIVPGGPPQLDPRSSFAEYLQNVEGRSTPWSAEQVSAGRLLGDRVAELTAGRARLRAELAATLQRTLMLAQFPLVPDVDGAARYLPSRNDPIGGDWYDVFFRPMGGPVIAIGDVAGHGLAVAATMAQLRHATRAYLVEGPFGQTMNRLNALVLTLLPTELATVVLVALDPETNTAEFVRAGHVPPIVTGPFGARLLDAQTNRPLGVDHSPPFTSARVTLQPDETLILYTDGLIERRAETLDAGLDRLLRAATSASSASVNELCDHLIRELGADVNTNDDVTIVALRFRSPSNHR